jgi:hypothetical protein
VVPLVCNAFGVDLLQSAARFCSAMPRGSWAGSEQTDCYGSEQRRFGAAGWQVDSNPRDVLDDARTNLDQALSVVTNSGTGERVRPRDRGAHGVHQPERSSVENESHLTVDVS